MTATPDCLHRECAHPHRERFFTWPTIITFARTLGTIVFGMLGAYQHSLTLLLWALGIYWIGDISDGLIARMTNSETRIGAMLDIMCDRVSAGVFYVGFAWYAPSMIVPVGIYLIEFMVIDLYLSLAFTAWPVSSPNYFYLVDRRIWLWNWSKAGKALNSGLFALLMILTRDPWVVGIIACVLLGLKLMSLRWVMIRGLPMPSGCVRPDLGPAPC